jgi:subtilisin family serine protease
VNTKFVMANRRAGMFADSRKKQSRDSLSAFWERNIRPNVRLIGDIDPPDETRRRIIVFEGSASEIAAKRKELGGDVILEPEIRHRIRPTPPTAQPIEAPLRPEIDVIVTGDGRPLQGVSVTLVLADPSGAVTQTLQVTDQHGVCHFTGNFGDKSPKALTAVPPGAFWSMIQPFQSSPVQIDCPRLSPVDAVEWWHQSVGITSYDQNAGAGIRIGVLDTGVGSHPCLSGIENLGSILGGKHDPLGGSDFESHGTHVCGLIASKPIASGQVSGISPGALVSSVRVFSEDGNANQGDVAAGIDLLSKDHLADIINLSLTASALSEIEHDAIIDAFERGTVCICAAGNASGAISFPAAFSEAVSVSALGRKGWGPAGAFCESMQPTDASRFGASDLFLARFSCFGPTLVCSSPGVGLISTVPERFGLVAPFGDLSGTSSASPIVAAVCARLLAADPTFQQTPRDGSRASFTRKTLLAHCQDIGLAPSFQGSGLPHV